MKNLVVLSGAGMSAESGLLTGFFVVQNEKKFLLDKIFVNV